MAKPPDFEPELLRRIEPWRKRAAKLVKDRLADAVAHAARAARNNSPRAAVNAATRAPSYRAAVERIDALMAEALVLIGDARERFYRDGFDLWRPHLDPAHQRADAEPTAAGLAAVRQAPINGYTPAAELKRPFAEALSSMEAATRLQGRLDNSERTLDVWAEKTGRSLTAALTAALSDSQIALFYGTLSILEK